MINYGIISTANIVKRFVEGIRNSKNGFVYGIASRDIAKAQKKADELAIEHVYENYQQLIEDENIDVVYVPTINCTHYEVAKMALERHKNVIVEKPFTLTSQQAEELFELSRKNNCFLMEGQKELFLPVSQKVKELLQQNAIGTIQYYDFSMAHPGRHNPESWMNDLHSGGGALRGSGAYPIEYLYYLSDTTCYKVQGKLVKGNRTADNFALFQLSNEKTLANCAVGMDIQLPNHLIIYGTEGKIIVEDFWKADHLTLIKGNEKTIFDFPFTSEFSYEVDHLNDCLAKHQIFSDIITPEMTIACIKVMETLYKEF